MTERLASGLAFEYLWPAHSAELHSAHLVNLIGDTITTANWLPLVPPAMPHQRTSRTVVA